MSVGCDSGSFLRAFFGDLGKAPIYLCLGNPDALTGSLGAALRADERLKPPFIITRSRERRWPWKLM